MTTTQTFALLAFTLAAGCITSQADLDDTSSTEQHGTGSGSSTGSGSAGSNTTTPPTGSNTSTPPPVVTGQPQPAMRCCSLEWGMDQSCRTDSSGLPVLKTTNWLPGGGIAGNSCHSGSSFTYQGTANASRCFDTASPPKDKAGNVEQWAADRWYRYKTFNYSSFIGMVPDTADGNKLCDGMAAGFRAALFADIPTFGHGL